MDMGPICFNSPIVHFLLLRQVSCVNLQVMKFNYKQKGVYFTKNDFGFISRLNDGFVSLGRSCLQSSSILDTNFNENECIKNSMIIYVFVNTTESKDIDDLVELALLYFLECGILWKASKKFINFDHLFMVENLDTLTLTLGI